MILGVFVYYSADIGGILLTKPPKRVTLFRLDPCRFEAFSAHGVQLLQTTGHTHTAKSLAPPHNSFPDCGRGRSRLARVTRELTRAREQLDAPPPVPQSRIIGKWSDPSILHDPEATPTKIMAKAAILVSSAARRKNRAELQAMLDDLNKGDLSDESVLRHVVGLPFGRKVDASALLVAAAQLCRQHCARRNFWIDTASSLTELGRCGTLDVEVAIRELNAAPAIDSDAGDGEMQNK